MKIKFFPIIKIIISIVIILLIIFRNEFYKLLNIEIEGFLNVLETTIFLIIGVINIWFIYMAIVEIYYIYENNVERKEKEIGQRLNGKKFLLEEILFLLDKNDIIEIKIKTEEELIKVGTSSDCKVDSNEFFDKRFYIENNEFIDSKSFMEQLKSYVKDGFINVVFIDGVKIKEYPKNSKNK